MRNIKNLLIAALLLSSTGCITTMRSLEENQIISDVVKQGDKVEIINTDGHISAFTVGKVTSVFIAGTSEAGSNVTVALADIETIKTEQIDGGKTTLAIVGGVVALPIIAAGVLLFGFACAAGGC